MSAEEQARIPVEIDWSLAPASAHAWKMTEFGAVWLEAMTMDVTTIDDDGIGFAVVGDPAPTFGANGNALAFRSVVIPFYGPGDLENLSL